MPQKTVSNEDVECSNTPLLTMELSPQKKEKKKEKEGIYHCRDSS